MWKTLLKWVSRKAAADLIERVENAKTPRRRRPQMIEHYREVVLAAQDPSNKVTEKQLTYAEGWLKRNDPNGIEFLRSVYNPELPSNDIQWEAR